MPWIRMHPFLWPAAVVLLVAACSEGATERGSQFEWREEFPTFVKHTIDDDFRGGYQAIAFDVDGDGLQDIVALSTGASRLVWYRNPTWAQYEIITGAERFISMAPHDINGNGRLDLAIASEFALGNSTSGGLVHWASAPEDPTSVLEWSLHPIDAVPTSHRVRWADVTGDGRKDLINLPIIGIGASSPAYEGAAELKAYRVPVDPTGPWETIVLDDTLLEVAHGLEVVDWDGDGTDDLLTASSVGVSLFRPALRGSSGYVIRLGEGKEGPRPDRGSSEVGLGMLGGEGRFLAAIEPWHGNEVVVYTPGDPDALPWSREVIESGLAGGHALVAADLNRDGYDEIIAGGRGGDRSLFIYRYRPGEGAWERIPLDLGGVAVSSIDVQDITGNGWLDLVVIGSGTNNVVWYENQGVP